MKSRQIALMLMICVVSCLLCAVVYSEDVKQPIRHEIPRDSLLATAKAVIDSTPFCVLVTLDETGAPRARPMDPFLPDSDMTIWLGTNRYTRKVEDIKRNPTVVLSYLMPGGMGYVSVYGTAKLVDDQAAKEKWWKPQWARFYPNKAETFLLIKVTPAKMEVINYRLNVKGEPKTWMPPTIQF